MQRPQVIASLVAATLVASAAGGMAFAKDHDSGAVDAMKSAKLSLTDAIAKAEQSVGGKAVEADIDDEKSGSRFEIGVLVNGKVATVFVDTQTGNVVKQGSDEPEENEGSEH